MADDDRSTPVTTAPPLANRARSVPAPQPTSSTRRAAIPVEVDEPQQVVQLLEVVLVEVGEEPRRPDRVSRDLEIVDVPVPVVADVGSCGDPNVTRRTTIR